MAVIGQKIAPCLWFDTQAEDAARFYVSVFRNSKLLTVSHFNKEGHEIHGRPAGMVMVAEFELDGQRFIALNGGPQFKFSEAISLSVSCADQAEVDYYWEKLTADGGQEGPCGWLKDKFGLSWQIVPDILPQLLRDSQSGVAQRVTKAFLRMKKLDIAGIKAAAAA
jgi:predicted 3-demethylubiquinone-9 3-methyltransferase (glyoxalase superfamily)